MMGIEIMPSQLVLAGGGIKSAVAAACAAKPDQQMVFLHLDYGQPSALAEHRALVALIPAFPQASLIRLPLGGLESLDRTTIKHAKPGVVDSPALQQPRQVQPLQPNPALIPLLISAATYAAVRLGASHVVTGFSHLCSTDHLGLPADKDRDSLRETLYALRVSAEALSPRTRPLGIQAPLLDIAYPQIIKLAKRLEVPVEYTWTCTAAGPSPCGKCPQCQIRESAFVEALELDPVATAG